MAAVSGAPARQESYASLASSVPPGAAEAQSAAFYAAGLASPGSTQPFDSSYTQGPARTKKISFKDTLRRTFGAGRRNSTSDSNDFVATKYASNTNSSAGTAGAAPDVSWGSGVMSALRGPTSPGVRTNVNASANANPGGYAAGDAGALPPVPIDPKLNSKDRKAQDKRLATLAVPGAGSGDAGTYGRSASMDAPRPAAPGHADSMSSPNVGANSGQQNAGGYAASGADAGLAASAPAKGSRFGFGLGRGLSSDSQTQGQEAGGFAPGGRRAPPVTGARRYGAATGSAATGGSGTGSVPGTPTTARKFSFGRSRSNSGDAGSIGTQGDRGSQSARGANLLRKGSGSSQKGSGGGGGFFQHRE